MLGLFPPPLLPVYIFSTLTRNRLFHSVLFYPIIPCSCLPSTHLYLLAEGSGVVLGAEAGVPVRPVQTGASVSTQVVFTHVHLLLAVHARVAELTGALVGHPVHAAVAVNAGAGGAGVGEEVAASAGPPVGAAAVVGVEEVVALAPVQAGAGLAHGGPAAAEERRVQGCLDELLLLQAREVHIGGAEVRQGNATQLHCVQAPSQGPASIRGQAA